MIIKAEIPTKIKYVYFTGVEEYIGSEWEIPSYRNSNPAKTTKITVNPTIASISGDLNSFTTAKSYITNHHKNASKSFQELEVDNTSISDIKILNQNWDEFPGHYKTLIDNKYCIFLSQDVITEALINSKIESGLLKGDFIWAKVQNKLKLIRVGSYLHTLVVNGDERKNKKPIEKKDFVVGGIYADIKGKEAVFLGLVNTVALRNKNTLKSPTNYWDQNYKNARLSYKAKYEFSMKKIKNLMLFYEPYNLDKTKIPSILQDQTSISANTYHFSLRDKHSYIEKIDDVVVPSDIVSIYRDSYIAKVKDIFTKHSSVATNYGYQPSEYDIENSIESLSKHINVCKAEDGFFKVPDFSKFVMFI